MHLFHEQVDDAALNLHGSHFLVRSVERVRGCLTAEELGMVCHIILGAVQVKEVRRVHDGEYR
jgi:hypothetical protein